MAPIANLNPHKETPMDYLTRNVAVSDFYIYHKTEHDAVAAAHLVLKCAECHKDKGEYFAILVTCAANDYPAKYVTAYCWQCVPRIIRRVSQARKEAEAASRIP